MEPSAFHRLLISTDFADEAERGRLIQATALVAEDSPQTIAATAKELERTDDAESIARLMIVMHHVSERLGRWDILASLTSVVLAMGRDNALITFLSAMVWGVYRQKAWFIDEGGAILMPMVEDCLGRGDRRLALSAVELLDGFASVGVPLSHEVSTRLLARIDEILEQCPQWVSKENVREAIDAVRVWCDASLRRL